MFMKLPASHQFRLATVAFAPLLLAIAGLAGCAQHLKVTGTWNEGATRPQTFKKLLIVGVSPDYRLRCNFEWALAQALRSDTVKTIVSCSAMTAEVHLSRETVERVIASAEADGVLATFLVASKTSIKEGGSRDTRGGGQYKSAGMGYGVYGMPVNYVEFEATPSIFTPERALTLNTQLYESRGASLVYSVQSTGKTQETNDVIIAVASQEIAARLRKAGLTP